MSTLYSKFSVLLNKKQRIKTLVLTLLLFFGMILEILGIGLLLPFLEVISNQDIIAKYSILENLFSLLLINSYNEQVYFLLFVLFILYLVKALYLIFLNYKQNIFLQNLNAEVASNLFYIYLNQPYSNYSKLKTSKLIKHITADVSFFNTFSSAVLSLITESGLLLALIISIVYIDPVGAFTIASLFILFSGIFYFFSRKKANIWGEKRNNLLEKISNISLEGFNGFKELLIFQKSKMFTKNYSINRFELSKIQSKMNTLSVIPRHYLEFISIFVFILFILLKLSEGSDISSLIPTLGVFIAASFKMIPSINKIIIASQNIKFYHNSIDIIISEFELKKNITETSDLNNLTDTTVPKGDIEFKKVFFTYTGEKPYILENINFKIERGKSLGIIGESGSGKSTLIDLIVGLLDPSLGNIYIDDKKNSFIPELLKKQIAYISQNVFLFDASIADNITMTNLNYNEKEKELIYKSIEDSDLTQMVQNLPEGIDTAVGENGINLSGGQKQRIAIARALYRNSKILILDEATSNLDVQTENKIIKSINKLKGDITLIIISHRLSILEQCDQIYEVKNSNLIEINKS